MPIQRLSALLCWSAAIWIAWELLWYEQYKLTGNEGSVYLFGILADWLSTPGGERPFRWFVGLIEVAAAMAVLLPRTQAIGAALAAGIMGGAMFFHLVSPLGIDPYGDGGTLFREAVTTFAAALVILALRRAELLGLLDRLLGRPPATVAG